MLQESLSCHEPSLVFNNLRNWTQLELARTDMEHLKPGLGGPPIFRSCLDSKDFSYSRRTHVCQWILQHHLDRIMMFLCFLDNPDNLILNPLVRLTCRS